MSRLLTYDPKDTWIHRLSGLTKLVFFLCLNLLAIFLFSPYEGVKIYGAQHDLLHIAGNYTITTEQLFYEFNIMIKYFTVIPAVLMFILTTNPSEFAASMNKIGVSYKISYSIAIALRYIPDEIGRASCRERV